MCHNIKFSLSLGDNRCSIVLTSDTERINFPLLLLLQLHSVSNLKPVIPSTVPDDFLEDDSGSDKPSSAPANGAAAGGAKKATKRGRKQAEKKPKVAKVAKVAPAAAAAAAPPVVFSQPPPIGNVININRLQSNCRPHGDSRISKSSLERHALNAYNELYSASEKVKIFQINKKYSASENIPN